jgi:hypothetical protein
VCKRDEENDEEASSENGRTTVAANEESKSKSKTNRELKHRLSPWKTENTEST